MALDSNQILHFTIITEIIAKYALGSLRALAHCRWNSAGYTSGHNNSCILFCTAICPYVHLCAVSYWWTKTLIQFEPTRDPVISSPGFTILPLLRPVYATISVFWMCLWCVLMGFWCGFSPPFLFIYSFFFLHLNLESNIFLLCLTEWNNIIYIVAGCSV